MTTRITADVGTLMHQAPDTAALYLKRAVETIDAQYGSGYAQKNPALVADFIKVCAIDFGTSMFTQACQDVLDRL